MATYKNNLLADNFAKKGQLNVRGKLKGVALILLCIWKLVSSSAWTVRTYVYICFLLCFVRIN